MKILCWNVAGIRATLRKGALKFLEAGNYDLVCFQETKAEEHQVNLPSALTKQFPWRVWRSTQGTTQRRGLSGTSIWSKQKPIANLDPPSIDEEGRVTALEFADFILVTVYTPNSQAPNSERCLFRTGLWDLHFREYIQRLNAVKPTILCGDFNVAHQDIDLHDPVKYRNRCAGFLDEERDQFQAHLDCGYIDAFRSLSSAPKKYTFWDQKLPYLRRTNRGWRIDYFLVPEALRENITACDMLTLQMGSDHCPIFLEICVSSEDKQVKVSRKKKRKKKLKLVEKL